MLGVRGALVPKTLYCGTTGEWEPIVGREPTPCSTQRTAPIVSVYATTFPFPTSRHSHALS